MMNKHLQFLILLLSVIGSLLLSSCRAKQTPTPVIRDFNIIDLLIGLPDMPNGWQIKGEPEHFREVGAFDAAKIAFISDENATRNGASLGVYNYGTLEEAKRVFNRIYEPRVYNDLPLGWGNPQISANRFKVGCYDWEGREPYACVWAAQYKEFIVQFDTWIIPGFMSFKDLENIAIAIDERMTAYLEMPLITPTN